MSGWRQQRGQEIEERQRDPRLLPCFPPLPSPPTRPVLWPAPPLPPSPPSSSPSLIQSSPAWVDFLQWRSLPPDDSNKAARLSYVLHQMRPPSLLPTCKEALLSFIPHYIDERGSSLRRCSSFNTRLRSCTRGPGVLPHRLPRHQHTGHLPLIRPPPTADRPHVRDSA